MPTPNDERFALAVRELGLADLARVDEALAALKALEGAGQSAPLASLFLLKGWLTQEQIRRAQERMQESDPKTVIAALDTATLGGVPEPEGGAPPSAAGSGLFPMEGSVFGRYVLVQELGRGGMGVVFRARDPQLDRYVALKLLIGGRTARAEDIVRFQREARAAARLQHPHLVQVHDIGMQDGTPFLTMDLIEGSSLDRRFSARDLDLRAGVELLRLVSQAVHYAHTQGIVHRDLKPGNILIDRAGRPFVTDFGLAKDLLGDGGQVTASTAALGTPSYMSPEQAAGRSAEVDARSDVFSLGVMLYQLLVGRTPFVGAHSIEIMMKLVQEEPEPPRALKRDVPADLETVCMKALEKDRTQRYATAEAFADDLGRWLRGEPVSVTPTSRLVLTLRRARRHRAAVLLALLLGLVGVLLLQQYQAGQVRKKEAELREAAEARRQEARTKARIDFEQGQAHLAKAREWEEARRCFGRALEADPTYVEAYAQRGRLNLLLFRWSESLADFGAAARLDPNLLAAHYYRGYIHFMGADFAAAAGDFAHVARIDPASDLGRIAAVCVRALKGDPGVALADAEALRKDLHSEELYLLLAWLHSVGARSLDQAQAALDEAGRLADEDPRVQVTRAVVELAWGRPARALVELSKALATVPAAPYLMRTRALAYRDLGRFEEALADLDECLRTGPRDADALVAKAKVLVLKGEPAAAAPLLAQAEALAPAWSEAAYARGMLERKQGRLDAALEAYRKAHTLEPGNDAPLVRMAEIHELREDPEAALAALDQALGRHALQPFEAYGAYLERGRLRGELGAADKAAEDYQAALRILPGSAEALQELGRALAALGQYEEAIAAWERARVADTRRGPGLEKLIAGARNQIFLKKEPLASAEEYVIRAKVWTDGIATAEPMTRLKLRMHAESDLKKAIDRDPRQRLAHFRLACLHAQWAAAFKGESDEAAAEHVRLALESLRQALECGYSPKEVRSHPDLEPVRTDPGYQEVLRGWPGDR